MAIPEFNVKEQWLGTGVVSIYTFDFTIQDPTHLLLILQDAAGKEVSRFRGNDNTFLSGIVFDAKNGGGTVTLLNPLTDHYVITALLAPDAPIQPSEFKQKFGFTLDLFEYALDRIVCQVQRLAYLVNRSMRLSDLDDVTAFNMVLPPNAPLNPGATIAVAADGSGLSFGATLGQIASAQTFAAQAQAAQTAALASQTAAAASAAAAAASAAAATCSVLTFGTPAVPLVITAAGGITSHSPQEEMQIINANAPIVISANPQISNGTVRGQKISLLATVDATPITFTNGNGLSMNGDYVMGQGDFITFIWDGTIWQEMYRRR